MARRRGGLDPAELDDLRTRLERGGRPRVRLSGPQFPPDATGTVVRIGDPATDGEDFVTVRLRVAGNVEELAFAPAELTAATAKPAKVTKAGRPAKTAKATAATPPSERVPPKTAAPTPAPAPAVPTKATAPAKATGPITAPAKATGSRRRPGPTPPVQITVASVGAAWSVSVTRGARTLVKNAPVTPGAVTAIAALIDNDGVTDAIGAVNDTARVEAEARAEQLRTELAQVQAVLDSHRTP